MPAPRKNTLNEDAIPVVRIDVMDIHNISEAQCVGYVISSSRSGRGGWLVTPNADIARQTHADRTIRTLIERADLRVADGMPLIWASRLKGTPLQGRVCGSDLVWSIAAQAAAHGLSLFLLGGGRPDTAWKAAGRLKAHNPGLNIAGTWYPPFGFEGSPTEMADLRAALRAANPDIVYVALGFPKAEKLIDELRGDFPGTWWLGIGISLSFIGGEVHRAPRWLQRLGLEWIHRLAQEPGRLAKRYLWHDIPYVARLLGSALLSRLASRR